MELVLPMRYFVVLVSAIVATVDSTAGPQTDHHEILGITRAATFEDIQNAFQKLSNMYRDRRIDGQPPKQELVDIHHAYEAISNKDMQADALRFVDYWGYVTPLEDDTALSRFMEFQPSGSSRLRMVAVVKPKEEDDSMHFELYASAVKFGHRIRVGQVSATDAIAPNGEPADFLKSLNLHRYPAVVLMDPITRIHKVRYILDGISGEVEQILNAGVGGDDKLGWLQEFDADAYKSRCQEQSDSAVPCSSIFLFATSQEFEQRREDLVTASKPFHEACKAEQARDPSVACFWLRRGRATDWDVILQQKFAAGVTGDYFGVAIKQGSPDKISLAPQSVIGGDVDRVTAWFKGVQEDTENMEVLAKWPALPKTLRITDEPAEDEYSRMFRKAMFHSGCVFYSDCRAKLKDDLVLQLHVMMQQSTFVKEYGLYEYYVQLKAADTETLTAVAGVVVLVLCAMFAVCKMYCCGRRSKEKTEAEAAESAEYFFTFEVAKPSADVKLGLDLDKSSAGGMVISEVKSGGLVDHLNSQQPQAEKRIRNGDRLACVSGLIDGAPSSAKHKDAMLKILGGMQSTFTVARRVSDRDKDLQKFVGTCNLCGSIPFHGSVKLGPVDGGGPDDIEIKELSPALVQWNEARSQEGACFTQHLEVGDRIIAVAERTNYVRAPPPQSPPSQSTEQEPIPISFVRWIRRGIIQPHQIHVNMEKSSEERWGMKLKRCRSGQLAIEYIVPTGALATKWNSNSSNPQILKGDRIVQLGDINDKDGMGDKNSIMQGMRANNLSICFERWVGQPIDSLPVSNGTHKEVPAVSPTVPMPFPTAQSAPAMPFPPALTTAVAPPIKHEFVNKVEQTPAPVFSASSAPPSNSFSAPVFSASSAPPSNSFSAPLPRQSTPAVTTVASTPVPVHMEGDGFPLLPVLFTMILGIALILGGLNGEKGSETAKRIPPQADMYMKKINPDLYPEVAGFLLLLGLLMAVNFMRNEFRENYYPGHGGGILQQLCGAAVASTFLGFGSFFLQAWSGVYA